MRRRFAPRRADYAAEISSAAGSHLRPLVPLDRRSPRCAKALRPARAQTIVPSRQKPKVAAKMAGFGPLSQTMSSGSIFPSATRRSDDHRPSRSPQTPPSSARTKPSVRSWRTMRTGCRRARVESRFLCAAPCHAQATCSRDSDTPRARPRSPCREAAARSISPPRADGLVLREKREIGVVLNV